ncbi:MAG: diguanylate cyclase [Alphaproteobacteria bacterium]|nr:diguanylate cyclase [Alphaproteobacteria bacterium]
MALDYGSQKSLVKLTPVLEEAAFWYSDIVSAVAYPDKASIVARLDSFLDWMQEGHDLPPEIIRDTQALYDDLMNQVERILPVLQAENNLPFDDFSELNTLYNAFLFRLYRLEADSALEGRGVDPLTGLRSHEAIEPDLKREMERLSRQGNPFALVVCRIDDIGSVEPPEDMLALVVRAIKQCMRSFDDAYYLGQGQFLLSLKHADLIGAQAAVTRLRQILSQDEGNKKGSVTLSYCMSEPLPEDKPLKIIEDMKDDLAQNASAQDAVLKLLEMSELERFVSTME